MTGQGLMPKAYDPIADALPTDAVVRALDAIRNAMSKAASTQMNHADFIARYL